jgi:hypothetical protein
MRRRLSVLAIAAAATIARPQESAIDRIAWLAGCWELRTQNRVTLEMWMPPAGGMMLGASRTVIGGAAREFEHLRITAHGDTLVYTSIPSGQRETDFRSTTVSAREIVFENRTHDFPQVIRYRRAGADSLIARIEGPGRDNTTRGFDFPMRRAACAASAPAPGIDPMHPAE